LRKTWGDPYSGRVLEPQELSDPVTRKAFLSIRNRRNHHRKRALDDDNDAVTWLQAAETQSQSSTQGHKRCKDKTAETKVMDELDLYFNEVPVESERYARTQ
jgi:hypothetical protein